MKKESNIREGMFRVVGDFAPFVKVDYMDKDAQEHTGLMLLDSGSASNVLSSEMAERLGTLSKVEDETMTLFAFSEKKHENRHREVFLCLWREAVP